jgi:UPF0716 family protein affecting phage T7 exclusion
MGKAGCLFGLLILGALSVELWAWLCVAQRLDDYLVPILLVVASSILGIKLAIHHAKQLPLEFLSGKAGRRLVAIIGAALLAFPGFLSDVLALPLLLPPVQTLLSRWGQVIAGALLRQVMSRMASGGRPGAGGFAGFPGFPGGSFPGGPFPGMQPDQRIARGKIIDTTVEK